MNNEKALKIAEKIEALYPEAYDTILPEEIVETISEISILQEKIAGGVFPEEYVRRFRDRVAELGESVTEYPENPVLKEIAGFYATA